MKNHSLVNYGILSSNEKKTWRYMLVKKFIIIILVVVNHTTALGHSGWGEHYADMIAVLGLEDSPKLKEWAKFISSDMIDKPNPFYNKFKEKHPGFQCKHRFLFHWGYNANPWNSVLESKTKRYCKDLEKTSHKRVCIEDTIALFKQELRQEQKRRNSLINKRTEDLFGFAHGGKDASFARFFASFAYNVHLIGDYTSDNTDLEGLQNLNEIIGLLVIELRNLDKVKSREVIRGISNMNKKYVGPQKKADALLKYLVQKVPLFLKEAQNGSIYRRIEKRGFKFRI